MTTMSNLLPGTAGTIVRAAILIGAGLIAGTAQGQTFSCPDPGGFDAVVLPAPPIPLLSLKTAPNPVLPKDPITGLPTLRGDLVNYIANVPAALQLGKALFWDLQAGSDNKTACATCHFQAGADGRNKNQLNPGANGAFNGAGPNSQLTSAEFPLSPQSDDVAGSQGVRKSVFKGFSKSGAELTASVADPVFNVGGKNVRQVTGVNAPTVINAVFNHRNFFNGRAQPEFNGVNPWGSRDTSARVWTLDSRGSPVQIDIRIPDASLASQAVGPALNEVEMSAAGRTFPDLGRKLLKAKPLALQQVVSTDSVLGSISDTGTGLTVSYNTLIQQAFHPKWWKSSKKISLSGKSYSMTEANFSLFWGLSIMLYEATLVSDDTPMDRYLASRVFEIDPATGLVVVDENGFPKLLSHAPSALDPVVDRLRADLPGLSRDDILKGLALFESPVAPPPSFPPRAGFGVGCSACHLGAEMSSAVVRNLAGPGLEPGHTVITNAGFDVRMERMFTKEPPLPLGTDEFYFDPRTYAVTVTSIEGAQASPPQSVPVTVYDAGWYNIGVRPTADDPGVDGVDPFGNSLSWTKLFQALRDPTFIKVPGGTVGCTNAGNAAFPGEVLNAFGFPLLSGPLQKNEATDVAGTFKVSALRNVELNGPYFHNGGKSTLRQLVEFYNRGADFQNPTLAPAIVPLGLTADQINSLVAFLLALTDERVRLRQAPFDHPQLFVPNGDKDNQIGTDNMVEIPAVGAGGSTTPLQRFLDLNPF